MTATPGTPAPVSDTRWTADARAAVAVAAAFPVLLLGVDGASGALNGRRAALWVSLSLILFVILWPTRVSAQPGLLTARGLCRRRMVHTDRLASVAWHDDVAQRLILRDLDGNRAEIDPRVLAANPPRWHLLDQDIRTSLGRGTMRDGRRPLQLLCRMIDAETARTVFRTSGMP
ncbi:hypothetical protein ACIO7M_22910 [Streptomyces toxytricini]|uniref:Uncharacterized protein n=1 Tax=Streptomyces toxytricini TaxID=67369 RepID=A0ABW8EL03_STRT5